MQNKNINDLPPTHPARQYKAFWNDLSVLDEVLLFLNDSRIVVPKAFCPQLLEKLHHSHSGIVKTKQLARYLYYWPGMSGDIEKIISLCDKRQILRQSQHDEPQIVPKAEAPMHCVSIDLFSFGGHEYVVCLLYTSPSPRDRG